jgi:amino acid adenylation domain-containing protein
VSANTISGLVEAAAAKRPDAVALEDADQELTFTELMTMAESIAAALSEQSEGQVIGVLMGPGIWTTIAALGAMRAGRAYLPLDPSLPEERLRLMAEAVDCDCLLVDAEPGRADWFGGTDIVAEAVAAVGRPCADPPPQDPGRLAYVIFTSGSTGRPKAVGVAQGPASVFVEHTAERLRVSPGDTVLQIHSTSFDSSIEEVWSTLARGARLVAPLGSILDVQSVIVQAAEHRVTVAHMPTSYWRAFVQEILDGLSVDELDALRHVEIGGEAMRMEDFEAWRACPLREVPLNNGYGPTEAVVTATAFTIGAETKIPAEVPSVPIGWALPGRLLYVVDDGGNPVQPGEPGELQIGGDQLAVGYLNDPELTARRFVADGIRGEGRKYRTGDLVRELPDGALEFMGRLDDQVKVRGFRVELGEISAALRSLDGVREALTMLLDSDSGRLGAAVELPSEVGLTSADLAHALERTLPGYMVPPVIVPLAKLPISVSGKIDSSAVRRILTDHDADG